MFGNINIFYGSPLIFFRPSNGKVGDVLVLTKPLGTQLATAAHIWQKEQNEKHEKLLTAFTDDDIMETFQIAIKSMTYLNRNGKLLQICVVGM